MTKEMFCITVKINELDNVLPADVENTATFKAAISHVNSLAKAIVTERKTLTDEIIKTSNGDNDLEDCPFPLSFYSSVSMLTEDIAASLELMISMFYADCDDKVAVRRHLYDMIDYKQEREEVEQWLWAVDNDMYGHYFKYLQCDDIYDGNAPDWCYTLNL